MKRIIKRTTNNAGEKCKTYVYDYENSILFFKFTLITNKDFNSMIGGETIIKVTDRYLLTYHRFSIKKVTLQESLNELGLKL